MSAGTPRGPYRLALRIYVVTVAAVVATGAALWLGLTLARERRDPPVHGLFRDFGRYAAAQLAGAWPDPARLRGEVTRLASESRLQATVYRWDGTFVTAAGTPAAPLSPGDREVLLRDGALPRGDCFRGRCTTAFPLRVDAAPVGYVLLDPPGPDGVRGPLPPPEMVALGLLLVGVGVAALVLGSSLARTLDRLARTARALGAGDLSARTGLDRRDEVGALARALDEMADRIVVLLRSQTELVANVAHELRTPLARIRVALDLAAEGDAAVARESLAEIGEDLAELEALVADVLASARLDLAGNTAGAAPPLRRASVAVEQLAGAAVERLRNRHPERTVELSCDPGLPSLACDAALLRRALDNLLDNARKYSPPDAPIAVRARPADGGAAVTIEVEDRGEGIAPEDLPRLFTPFFRADRSRNRATGGVGLGLALSRRIVEAHGGTLVARSVPGEGTTMALTVPAAAQQSVTRA